MPAIPHTLPDILIFAFVVCCLFLPYSLATYEYAVVRTLRKYPPERRFARISKGLLRYTVLAGILPAISTAISELLPPSRQLPLGRFLLDWVEGIVLITILYILIALFRYAWPHVTQRHATV